MMFLKTLCPNGTRITVVSEKQGRENDDHPRWVQSTFGAILAENSIQKVHFWKSRKSKMEPKTNFLEQFGAGTL